MKKKRMMSLTVTGGETDVEDAERLRDANLQRVAEGMSRWCKPQEIEARENRTSAKPALTCEVLEAELWSALSKARAEEDRVAALVEAAAAETAAWAEQLADVVKVLKQSDEAGEAGKDGGK